MVDGAVRTRVALYTVAAYQAVALTTVQFVVPVYAGDLRGMPSRLLANLVLFSLPFLAGFVLAHVIGSLSDVTGRVKPWMLLALGGHLAGLLLLSVAARPWQILASAALAASFTGTLNTTLKTYVTRLSEERKGRGLSKLTQASQVGWLIGGILCATLLKDLGPESARKVIVADVGITLLAVALVAWLLPRLSGGVSRRRADAAQGAMARLAEVGRDVRGDLRRLYSEPALVRACLAAVFLQAGNWTFISTYSLYIVKHLGADPVRIGWINGAGAIVTLLVLPWIGRLSDHRGPGAAIRVAAIAYVGVYAPLAIFPSLPMAALVFSVPAYAALLIGLASAAADIGGVKRRGGGIGVVDGLWAIATAVGSAVGGLVADVDLALIPVVALLLTGVGLLLAWGAAPRIDARLERENEPTPLPDSSVAL